MTWVRDSFNTIISTRLVPYSYWVVKRDDGKLISELHLVSDPHRAQYTVEEVQQYFSHLTPQQQETLLLTGKRPVDWTLDLVTTGDIYHIKELWLICPPNPGNPTGNTARLPIIHRGGAFQLKVANLDIMGAWGRYRVAHIIGRMDNLETGDCTVFAWDDELRALIAPYHTNIHSFETWRPGIAPPQHINLPVLGIARA